MICLQFILYNTIINVQKLKSYESLTNNNITYMLGTVKYNHNLWLHITGLLKILFIITQKSYT